MDDDEKPRAEEGHKFIVTDRAGKGNRCIVGEGNGWGGANVWRDREGRTEQLAPLVGRLVLDETPVPRADVLAPQETNVEGGDLKRPIYLPREASSAALPKSMVQEEQTIRRWDGPEPVVGASGDWSGEEAAVEVGGEAEEGGPVPGK